MPLLQLLLVVVLPEVQQSQLHLTTQALLQQEHLLLGIQLMEDQITQH